MFFAIGATLFIIWVLGLVFHFFGGLIYIFLVAAVISWVLHLLFGRRAAP
jgi:hypothetical protein